MSATDKFFILLSVQLPLSIFSCSFCDDFSTDSAWSELLCFDLLLLTVFTECVIMCRIKLERIYRVLERPLLAILIVVTLEHTGHVIFASYVTSAFLLFRFTAMLIIVSFTSNRRSLNLRLIFLLFFIIVVLSCNFFFCTSVSISMERLSARWIEVVLYGKKIRYLRKNL